MSDLTATTRGGPASSQLADYSAIVSRWAQLREPYWQGRERTIG